MGREDGMGRGSLEPAVAKCKFCSVLGMLVCVCKKCGKKSCILYLIQVQEKNDNNKIGEIKR